MIKKTGLLVSILLSGTALFAQVDALTPAEIRYRDSITKLNQQNNAIAASQESYNQRN